MRYRLALGVFLFAFVSPAAAVEPKLKLGDVSPSPEKPILDPPDTAKLANDIADEFYDKGLKALNDGNLEQAEGYFDRVLILIPHHQGAQDGINTIMKAYEQPAVSTGTTETPLTLVKTLEKSLNEKFAAGDLEGADEVAEKILAIDPHHKEARQKQSLIHRLFFDRALVRANEREKAGDLPGAMDALRAALSYRKDSSVRLRLKSLQAQMVEANVAQSDTLYVEALAASQNGDTGKAVALCHQALFLNPGNQQAARMLTRLSP